MDKNKVVALLALIVKEFRTTLKEKTSRMILVGPLIIYCALFGYIATFNLSTVPYALLDNSGTELSRSLVRNIEGTGVFQREADLQNSDQIADTIDSGKTLLVVVIPQDFERLLTAGEQTPVQIIIDGRNSTTAGIALGYLTDIARTFESSLSGKPELFSYRYYYNENNITQWFVMPALIVMLTMLQVIILSALSVSRERERGTFDQLLVAPYDTWQIILAKGIVPMVIGCIQGLLIMLFDILWFNIPFRGNFLLILFILFIFMLSVVGIGLAISAYSKTMQQSLLLSFLVLVPMVLLSGFFTSVQNMPEFIQLLTWLDPLRFGITAVRRVYLAGAGFTETILTLRPVIILSIFSLSGAYYFFKRRV